MRIFELIIGASYLLRQGFTNRSKFISDRLAPAYMSISEPVSRGFITAVKMTNGENVPVS